MAKKNIIEILIRADNKASGEFSAIGGDALGMAKKIAICGGIAGAAIAGIGYTVLKFVDRAAILNREMANIGTLIPGSLGRLESLKDTIRDISLDVVKATGDLARGGYQIISAFGDTAATTKLLTISAKAAKAGIASTLDAVNLISAAMKGYGYETTLSAEKTADLAFKTVELGQTTFPELAQSMGLVIPLAATLHVKQEELFTDFATLTGVTGTASDVTTQLASIMRGLIKPTEDMQRAIRSLGYASGLTMTEELGLNETMERLIGTTDGSAESIGKLWENVRGYPAIFALMGTQAGIFDQKLAKMNNSLGASAQAFLEQTDGINSTDVAIERLKQRFSNIAESIGDELSPAVGVVVEDTDKIIENLWNAVNYLGKYKKMLREAIAPPGGPTKLIEFSERDLVRTAQAMSSVPKEQEKILKNLIVENQLNKARNEYNQALYEVTKSQNEELEKQPEKIEESIREYNDLLEKTENIKKLMREGIEPITVPVEVEIDLPGGGTRTLTILPPEGVVVQENYNELLAKEEEQLKQIIIVAKERLAVEDERRAKMREAAEGWSVTYPTIDVGPLPAFDQLFGPAILDSEELRENIESTTLAVDELAIELEDVPPLVNRIAKATENAERKAQDLRERFDFGGEEFAMELTNTFGNALEIMLSDAGEKTRAIMGLFASMAAYVIAQLAKMAFWKFVMMPLLLNKGGEFVGAQKGLQFSPAQEGLQFNFAQSGLEALGGQYFRDTIPVAIGRGEVVSPSPHVERVEHFMETHEKETGGNTYYITPFVIGSREEAMAFGQYSTRRQSEFGKFVAEGIL